MKQLIFDIRDTVYMKRLKTSSESIFIIKQASTEHIAEMEKTTLFSKKKYFKKKIVQTLNAQSSLVK